LLPALLGHATGFLLCLSCAFSFHRSKPSEKVQVLRFSSRIAGDCTPLLSKTIRMDRSAQNNHCADFHIQAAPDASFYALPRGRVLGIKISPVNSVHLIKILQIPHEDVGFDDMVHCETHVFHNVFQIFQY
ncbi:hypothetical protein AALA80_18145, partial [Oscillospiraceae bacterium 50-60]